jgi:hypothetical protein
VADQGEESVTLGAETRTLAAFQAFEQLDKSRL